MLIWKILIFTFLVRVALAVLVFDAKKVVTIQHIFTRSMQAAN